MNIILGDPGAVSQGRAKLRDKHFQERAKKTRYPGASSVLENFCRAISPAPGSPRMDKHEKWGLSSFECHFHFFSLDKGVVMQQRHIFWDWGRENAGKDHDHNIFCDLVDPVRVQYFWPLPWGFFVQRLGPLFYKKQYPEV